MHQVLAIPSSWKEVPSCVWQRCEAKPTFCQRTRFPACMLSCFSHVWLFATPWTVARQAPLFMGFSRQEYWSGLPCPSPGDLPDPGIKSICHVSCIGRQAPPNHMPSRKHTHQKKKKRSWRERRQEVVLLRKAVESQGPSVAPSSTPQRVRGEALGWQWQGQQYTSCHFCKWNVCNRRVPIILKQWAVNTRPRLELCGRKPHHTTGFLELDRVHWKIFLQAGEMSTVLIIWDIWPSPHSSMTSANLGGRLLPGFSFLVWTMEKIRESTSCIYWAVSTAFYFIEYRHMLLLLSHFSRVQLCVTP